MHCPLNVRTTNVIFFHERKEGLANRGSDYLAAMEKDTLSLEVHRYGGWLLQD